MKMKMFLNLSVATTILLLTSAARLQAAEAKENWENNCAKCHGVDGKGQTKMGRQSGVKDYTDAAIQAGMKEDEMLRRLKEGIKEGTKEKMPSYKDKLSEQELKELLALVRSFKK